DTANSGGKKETKAIIFHKIMTEEINDRYVAPCLVNGLEEYGGEINLGMEENMISNEFAVKLCLDHEVKHGHKVVKKELIVAIKGEIYFVKFIINPEEDDVEPKEEKPVIETMAYSDKYKKLLDEICLDNMKMDEEMKKEEEEAIIKVKGEALIKKEDPGRGSDGCKKRNNNVKPFKGRAYEAFRGCLVPAKTSLKTEESDSDDEEDYGIQRNKFKSLIYGPKSTKYLNCHDPLDRSIALQEVLSLFRKICVWKKAVSFLGSLHVALQHEDWKPGYTRNYCNKAEGDEQWHAEIRLEDPYGNVYDQGFATKKTSIRFSKYHKFSDIMSPNWFKE
nr:hypothetical protein [Tanacetum cinerariifolium]